MGEQEEERRDSKGKRGERGRGGYGLARESGTGFYGRVVVAKKLLNDCACCE